jgi:serine/threonine protein kinase
MHHKKYISFVLPWYGTLNLCEPMPKPARNQHRCWNISRAAGGDLLEVLVANTYLDDINARRIFRDVVSALAYLHRHRIIHRDIKVPTIVGEVSVMLIGCRQREREIADRLWLVDCSLRIYCSLPMTLQPAVRSSPTLVRVPSNTFGKPCPMLSALRIMLVCTGVLLVDCIVYHNMVCDITTTESALYLCCCCCCSGCCCCCCYTAPEILKALDHGQGYDVAVDMFSLGVVVYQSYESSCISILAW